MERWKVFGPKDTKEREKLNFVHAESPEKFLRKSCEFVCRVLQKKLMFHFMKISAVMLLIIICNDF